MAINVTLATLSSGYNTSVIDSNFQAIKTALADAVSRSGTTPNTMTGDLDLNSNNILNGGTVSVSALVVGGTTIDTNLLLNAAALTQAVDDAEAAQAAAETAETGAETAQAAAEAAQAAAELVYDNFDDRYLGAKASDPTLDNDGNALVTGALYFNTSSNAMKVYNGSSWAVLVNGTAALTTYDNSTSGLTATDVQDAIDEVEGRLDTAESDITTIETTISTLGITVGTAQTVTGVTNVEFTSLPSGINKITLSFYGLSFSGATYPKIQVGYSGGYETSGYACRSVINSGAAAASSATDGLIFYDNGPSAAEAWHGEIVFTRHDGDKWVACGDSLINGTASNSDTRGYITISGELDRIRLISNDGSSTIDAGSVNIMYQQ